ncbi:glycosyl hydrolase family 18 protein [Streptosporangium canum]|uniref:glycosyl hydrolase family 18 protein n=1 Tax=Streptosporangium canum TaxID=324952 RepID=UPI00378B9BD8
MRRITIGSLIAAAALLVPVGMSAATAATPATATYSTASDWGSGFEGKVTVKAGTSALTSWKVEFDLPAGNSIASAWDADLTKSGNHYTFVNKAWNGALAAGASVSFGFNGAPGGLSGVLNCKLNGAACNGTGTPDPTPTPTVTPTVDPTPTPTPTVTPTVGPDPSGKKVVGYFTEWGVYGRNYHVKNLVTSGSAAKLTHILYAFGNSAGGRCSIGDSYADYDKAYTADQSVDGVADTWDQPLRGNFNQLRKLKKAYPNIKVIYSIGGWTWSGGFTQAAANPAAFADSCYKMVEDPRWADVFDGIDIDWEYPNACGLTCDTSGPAAYKNVLSALRAKFGPNALITSAITADGSTGGKMDVADYAGGAQYLDWIMPMTYDFFGSWDTKGPTAPHSPLTAYPGIPKDGYNSDAAIQKLKGKGVPAGKILLGIGFYGRGWTGVTQATPGGTATGAAPGTYEAGNEDYKVLKTKCPATGTIGGTAYGFCNGQWWGYDTPATITGKMTYAKNQGLGGAFFWETSGDTANGELISAISNGLK